MDEEKRLCGLNYARSLNFTDAQYEEALKRIDSPDNANQLLVALIDVSSRDTLATTTTATNQINSNSIQVQPKTATNSVNVVGNSAMANSMQDAGDSSSSLSTSCYSSITSFPSSSDQSLESLPQQHQQQRSTLQPVVVPLRRVYIDGSNVART